MTEQVLQFFIFAATAALLQNVVLSSGIGASTVLFSAKGAKHIFAFGSMVTFMALAASMSAFGINLFIANWSYRIFVRPILFILCIVILYYIVYFTAFRFMKSAGEYVCAYLPYAAFNCVVLGIIYIALNGKYSLIETAGFALGSGAGFIIASLLIAEGRRRLETVAIPKAFRGLPVTLLYIGLLSLALYGLIGHQLPF